MGDLKVQLVLRRQYCGVVPNGDPLSTERVSHDGQISYVEPQLTAAMLKIGRFKIRRHVTADDVQECVESLAYSISGSGSMPKTATRAIANELTPPDLAQLRNWAEQYMKDRSRPPLANDPSVNRNCAVAVYSVRTDAASTSN